MPFISQENVRLALDMLVYSTKGKQTSLLWLSIIDEFLANPDLPRASQNREFALSHILISILTTEYAHHREIRNYSIPQKTDTRSVVLQALEDDAQSQSPELLGWSWLYHRYVRVDIDLQVAEFCRLVHLDERSLRRYQQNTIKRLTKILIEMEWEARARQRKRMFFARLPTAGTLCTLIGRDEEYRYVSRLLQESNIRHFLVTGTTGIGKTSFVEAVVSEQVKKNEVDQLVWITRPLSLAYIHHHLIEKLLLPESRISLREYLLMYRTWVVLDDIDLFQDHSDALADLLQLLSPAVVFLTSAVNLLLPNTVEIRLGGINKSQVQIYTHNHFNKSDELPLGDLLDHHIAEVWKHRDNNNNSTKARSLSSYKKLIQSINGPELIPLLNQLFQEIDQGTGYLWVAFALSPPGKIIFRSICNLWPNLIDENCIEVLIQYGLVETYGTETPYYRLIDPARRFVVEKYHYDEQIFGMVSYLVQELNNIEGEITDFSLSVIEHILTSTWIELDDDLRTAWISIWWKEGVRHRHWSVWKVLLEKQLQFNNVDFDLSLGYVTCLRNLADWRIAREVIQTVIGQMGRQGKFAEQARALLELAVILRHTGEYEKALNALGNAHRIISRWQMDSLIPILALEQAQIAIDLGDCVTASSYMSSFPVTVQALLLRSEIHLFKKEYEHSRICAQQAIDISDQDPLMRAHSYVLIGRAYEEQDFLEAALEYFSWAVTIFEQQRDLLSLARAKSNLGAVLLRIGNYDEAGDLLYAAEKAQIRFNDRVALAATRHNLRLLHRVRATRMS